MKYNTKIQKARQKYLKGLPLSEQEQALIEKDLSDKDFLFFTSDDAPLILPDKYKADTTYRLVEKQIRLNKSIMSRPLIKYAGYAAAVLLLFLISTVVYNYAKQPEVLYVTTSYGEKKEVELPDGSVVILNSLSSIAYPQKMNGKTREVSLEGEAYFDVVKNPNQAFIVKAKNIEVKVLGTKFNIDAYENQEHITTTLFDGIVSVEVHSGYTKKLKPGEQAVFSKKTEKLEVQQLKDLDIETAWRNNLLVFENEPLIDILDALSREHNVNFEINNQTLAELRITARFASGESIERALTILGQTAEFTYIKQGNKYKIVTRK